MGAKCHILEKGGPYILLQRIYRDVEWNDSSDETADLHKLLGLEFKGVKTKG